MIQKVNLLDAPPPADHEAEEWTVGSVLLNPACVERLGYLELADFTDATLGGIFGAVRDLRRQGQPVDLALLKRHLPGDDWASRIYQLSAAVPVAGHVDHYAKLVARAAAHRRIREILLRGLDGTHEASGEPEALLEQIETELGALHVSTGDDAPRTLHDAAVDAAVRVDAIAQRGQFAGLPTGLVRFDEDMGGLFPGELVILAARPGVGKTSLGLQIAAHNAQRNRLVYFASLEMSGVELSTRLACGQSGVSNRLVRIGRLTDRDMGALSEAFNKQSTAALEVHDRSFFTVETIRREIRKRKRRGLVLAVVDYLQLVTPLDRKVNREQQVATTVRALKETARSCNLPILCLCQLNRQAGDETPRLHHLREFGAIEQDADVVLFLSPHEPTPHEPHNAVLTVAKNRNGETSPMRLNWHPGRTTFTCCEGGPFG